MPSAIVKIVPLGGLPAISFSQGLIQTVAGVNNVDFAIFREDEFGNADGMQLTSTVELVNAGFTVTNFFFQTQAGVNVSNYTFSPGATTQIVRIGNITGHTAGTYIDLSVSGPNEPSGDWQPTAGNGVDKFVNLRIEFN